MYVLYTCENVANFAWPHSFCENGLYLIYYNILYCLCFPDACSVSR